MPTNLMPANLLETINSYFTPDLVSKASSFLHESPANTSTALSGIIPALLGRISDMASSPWGAKELEGLLTTREHDGSILNNPAILFAGGGATAGAIHQGEDLLRLLFRGKNMESAISSISNFSGIGRGSASSLMALAAPLVMGAIGKLRTTQGLDSTGLSNLLAGQKATIASAIPAGLANSLDEYNIQGLRSVTVTPTAVQKSRSWWSLFLLLALALGLILYALLRGKPAAPVAAVSEQVKLCGGDTLSLMRGSFNYNLARYLVEGSNAALPKTFVFDNLNFDSDTTTLTPPSHQTVNDLITVLKSCPTAQVQLVGYTDNTGDPAINLTLSQNRANAIRDMLAAGGISLDRMTTAGYGQDRPIASNDTDEGRARNRRTELVVLNR
jgi:OmpA-OmpF porin, OOP family